METSPPKYHASYGRKRGRRLRVTKQDLFDTLLPELLIRESISPHPSESRYPVWTPACAGVTLKRVWLEIGFGGGEHLAHQASLHPDVAIIGCEPYVNGIAGLLKHIDDAKVDNIRIWTQDARLLMDALPDASLEKVFILYPDPWPKARHHKRRLISTAFLDKLARIMKTGAELRLATDDEDYGTWMLEHLLPHPSFSWQAKTSNDWVKAPADWVSTRYEQKALAAGRMPIYLNFVRV